MVNKKRLKEISSSEDKTLLEEIKLRNAKKQELRTYKRLALEILLKLDEKRMTQKQLAEKLGVSAQYVNKLVKGNEKFGGEILVKLEEVLQMPIFVQNLPREKKELLIETNVKKQVFSGKMATVFSMNDLKYLQRLKRDEDNFHDLDNSYNFSVKGKSTFIHC